MTFTIFYIDPSFFGTLPISTPSISLYSLYSCQYFKTDFPIILSSKGHSLRPNAVDFCDFTDCTPEKFFLCFILGALTWLCLCFVLPPPLDCTLLDGKTFCAFGITRVHSKFWGLLPHASFLLATCRFSAPLLTSRSVLMQKIPGYLYIPILAIIQISKPRELQQRGLLSLLGV